jgi:hypothetical protein
MKNRGSKKSPRTIFQTQKLSRKSKLNLERKAWRELKSIINKINKFDKRAIRRGKSVTFTLIVFNFCLGCKKVVYTITVFADRAKETRKNLKIFVNSASLGQAICKNCGEITIPIGYSTTGLAYYISSKDGIPEKLKGGCITNHPKRKKFFFTLIVTSLGKKEILELIIQKHKKVYFKKINNPLNCELMGRLVLSQNNVELVQKIENYNQLSSVEKSLLKQKLTEIKNQLKFSFGDQQ